MKMKILILSISILLLLVWADTAAAQSENCTFTLSPRENVVVTAAGGTYAFTVTPSHSNCQWIVTTVGFGNVSTSVDFQSGRVTMTVAPNTRRANTTIVKVSTVAGENAQSFSLAQEDACGSLRQNSLYAVKRCVNGKKSKAYL
jgi:hypothetical protein